LRDNRWVLRMANITEMSTIVAATGVLVGMVLAVVELRNLVKQRKTELVTHLYSVYCSKGFQEELYTFLRDESIDMQTYRQKFPLEFPPCAVFFNQVGTLLEKKLIEMEMVDSLFGGIIPRFWKHAKPLLESERKLTNTPKLARGLEYLGNEIQKYQAKKD